METKKSSDGRLFKFLIAFMVLMFIRSYNMKRNKKTARTMEYSDSNDYAHISPMKHDIFKTITVDIVPLFIFSMATSKTFFSVEEFQSSVIGKSLITVTGLMVYYQVVQPYFVNSKLIPC